MLRWIKKKLPFLPLNEKAFSCTSLTYKMRIINRVYHWSKEFCVHHVEIKSEDYEKKGELTADFSLLLFFYLKVSMIKTRNVLSSSDGIAKRHAFFSA